MPYDLHRALYCRGEAADGAVLVKFGGRLLLREILESEVGPGSAGLKYSTVRPINQSECSILLVD